MNERVKPLPLIMDAVEDGDESEVSRLFAIYPEALHMRIPLGGNWLNYAAGYGTLDMVKYFLSQGFEINTKAGALEERALACATQQGRCDIAEYLIDQGAIFDMSSSMSNPLFCAMSGDSLEMIKLLLEKGCDPRIKYDFGTSDREPYEMDVFMKAREWGKMEIARAIADWTHIHYGYPAYAEQEAAFLASYPGSRDSELR